MKNRTKMTSSDKKKDDIDDQAHPSSSATRQHQAQLQLRVISLEQKAASNYSLLLSLPTKEALSLPSTSGPFSLAQNATMRHQSTMDKITAFHNSCTPGEPLVIEKPPRLLMKRDNSSLMERKAVIEAFIKVPSDAQSSASISSQVPNTATYIAQACQSKVAGLFSRIQSPPARFYDQRPTERSVSGRGLDNNALRATYPNMRSYIYIILEDGRLRIGTQASHGDLAEGRPVLAAGEIHYIRDKYFVNTHAPDYKPEGRLKFVVLPKLLPHFNSNQVVFYDKPDGAEVAKTLKELSELQHTQQATQRGVAFWNAVIADGHVGVHRAEKALSEAQQRVDLAQREAQLAQQALDGWQRQLTWKKGCLNNAQQEASAEHTEHRVATNAFNDRLHAELHESNAQNIDDNFPTFPG